MRLARFGARNAPVPGTDLFELHGAASPSHPRQQILSPSTLLDNLKSTGTVRYR
jgi:hypothetical protein